MVVLSAPGGGDGVTQLFFEADLLQREVGEHAHHVDDERLALGPVERLTPRLVDEGEEIARHCDGVFRPARRE
jgi:hypothetical protein